MVEPRGGEGGEGIEILVVEDELPIQRGLCDVLEVSGYRPLGSGRGDEGLALALEERFELILLDLMLPGMSGFDVCERLRQARPTVPILMLTARGSEEDVLRGFRCGADDYVTKPFSLRQLMARVEALLRRATTRVAEGDGGTTVAREPFAFGTWHIDPEQLIATHGDERFDLTRRDSDILALFVREAGRIVSRRLLLRELWGYPDPDRVETRTVDMHIAKLRKKLDAPRNGLIETVRGEGYRYVG